MPRITKAYTGNGDEGCTNIGSGERVRKSDARINACGTVDELNSYLGIINALQLSNKVKKAMSKVQNDLFILGSDLCFTQEYKKKTPVPVIEERHIKGIEAIISRISGCLKPLKNFIIPSGSIQASHLQYARTVCRRAEREVVALSERDEVNPEAIKYLNRLSSLLYQSARYENKRQGIYEKYWDSRA